MEENPDIPKELYSNLVESDKEFGVIIAKTEEQEEKHEDNEHVIKFSEEAR